MSTIWVPGIPRQQGNHRVSRTGHIYETSQGHATWRATIAHYAAGLTPLDGAVVVLLDFRFPRPRYHYGTGRNSKVVKATAPVYKTGFPDGDKLTRCCLDGLSGLAYHDDAQVVGHVAWKGWAGLLDGPGVTITVLPADDGMAPFVAAAIKREPLRLCENEGTTKAARRSCEPPTDLAATPDSREGALAVPERTQRPHPTQTNPPAGA